MKIDYSANDLSSPLTARLSGTGNQKMEFSIEKSENEFLLTNRLLPAEVRDLQANIETINFRFLADNLPNGLSLLDKKGRIIFINRSLANMLGYESPELIGESLYSFLDDGNAQMVYRLMEQLPVLQSREMILELNHREGRRVFVSVHIFPYNSTGANATVAVVSMHDVTSTRIVEEQLRESEERFRLLFHNAPIGAAVLGLDGKYLMVNLEFSRFLGYTEEELKLCDYRDVTLPQDLESSDRRVDALTRGLVEHYKAEKRYCRKNGETVWGRISVSMMNDRTGNPLYFLSMVEDITEAKRIEKQLQNKREELDGRIRELNCLYGISALLEIQNISLGGILQGAVYLVSRSIRNPDRSRVRISLDNDVYLSEQFGETGDKIAVAIKVNGNERGFIEIFYESNDTEAPDATVGEKSEYETAEKLRANELRMLDAVAGRLGKTVERLQALEGLCRSEELQRMLLYSTAEAIYAIDRDGNCTFCNPVCLQLLGYNNPDELIGRKIHEIIQHSYSDGTARDPANPQIQSVCDSGVNSHDSDAIFWRADGTPLVVEYWSYPVKKNDEIVGAVVTFLDITERKWAEELLHWELAVNGALAELSGKLIMQDDSMEAMAKSVLEYALGLTASESGMLSIVEIEDEMKEDERCGTIKERELCSVFDSVNSSLYGESVSMEILRSIREREPFFTNNPETHFAFSDWKLKNKEIRNLISVPAVIDGQMVGRIMLANSVRPYEIRDLEAIRRIVELYALAIHRQRMVSELRAARVRAEDADRIKSTFLANMSHELRTPLNAIIGYTDLLLQEKPDQNQLAKLETIRDSGRLLLALIQDILDLARVESGHLELERIAFSLPGLLDNVESAARSLLSRKKEMVELRMFCPAEIPPGMMGDSVRIRQVLNNLIGNAVKFTEKGFIECGVELLGNGLLEFHVRDTGIGIPSERRELVFEPFRQAEARIARSYGGSGLGLAICRKLVELMGGEIRMESITGPGHGTVFYFTVPHEPVDFSEEQETIPQVTISGRNRIVLVVDDNDVNRALSCHMLEYAEYRTIQAVDGREAVYRFRTEENLVLILMDLQMPVLDGLEAVRVIREIEKKENRRERIPIIALTAEAMKGEREKCLQAGFDDYLTKPFECRELLQRMETLIE